MPKPKTEKDPKITYSVVMPSALNKQLIELAKAESDASGYEISKNMLITRALNLYAKNHPLRPKE